MIDSKEDDAPTASDPRHRLIVEGPYVNGSFQEALLRLERTGQERRVPRRRRRLREITMAKTSFPDAVRGTVFYGSPNPPSKGGFVVWIGVDTDDGPEHILYSVTRRNTTLSESMMASIDAKGVEQPVIVRKNGPLAEMVVGRRRLNNLRAVNENRIAKGEEPHSLPMLKFEGTDEELLELMMSENIEREEETDEELARLAARLLKSKSREHVARICHCSTASLGMLLQVNDLHPEIRKETGRGLLLSRDAAVKLVDLTFDDQLAALEELKKEAGEGKRITARDVVTRVAPDKVLKPKGSQLKRLVAMLDQDAKAKKSDRYFEIDDPAAFSRDIVRVCLGEIKPNKIKGMTAVLDGKVKAE